MTTQTLSLDLSKYKQVKIQKIQKVESKEEVFYDLTVEDDHTFHIVSGDRKILFKNCDGMHIVGLLIGFIMRYLPEYKERVAMLRTPVMTVTKNKKLVSWHYNLGADIKLKSGEVVNYKKGLGSWKEAELKEIISKDSLEQMINLLDFDSEKIIEDWLGNSSDSRKEYILANEFSIAKL